MHTALRRKHCYITCIILISTFIIYQNIPAKTPEKKYSDYFKEGRRGFDYTSEEIFIEKNTFETINAKKIVSNKLRWPKATKRLEDIKRRCNKHSTKSKIDLKRLAYDDKHEFIMCSIPKASSMSWKKMLWYLTGREKNKTLLDLVDRQKFMLAPKLLQSLSMLNESESQRRLSTYTKVLVTREPYQRFISAFTSKFSNRYGSYTPFRESHGLRIAKSIAPHYMHGVNYNVLNEDFITKQVQFKQLNETIRKNILDFVEVMRTGALTLEQFSRYVSFDNQPEALDAHWRPQTDICDPCTLPFDYIIEFDDLAEDSNILLEYLQTNETAESQIRFDGKTKNLVQLDYAKTMLLTLDKNLLDGLKRLYLKDFEILGYNSTLMT